MSKTTTRERAIRLTDAQVRAALDGRLSEVREVVKPTLPEWDWIGWDNCDPPQLWSWRGDMDESAEPWERLKCPWQPGDVLWVQETWAADRYYDERTPSWLKPHHKIYYGSEIVHGWHKSRPSTQLPRWASRIEFEVTAVRAEKLSAITLDGVHAEGVACSDCWTVGTPYRDFPHDEQCGCRNKFANDWNRRYPRHPFDSDCWVWVRQLRRIKP